jgi:hypothetical protein
MATTTHPVTQKKDALAAAAKGKPAAKAKATATKATPATPAKKAPSRWRDSAGVDLVKGLTVKAAGKIVGTVAYRHTHDIDGKPVGMIGVALSPKAGDLVTLNGRKVKNRTFRADELTAVPE